MKFVGYTWRFLSRKIRNKKFVKIRNFEIIYTYM